MPIRFLREHPCFGRSCTPRCVMPGPTEELEQPRAGSELMTRSAQIVRSLNTLPSDFVRSLFKRPETTIVRLTDPHHSNIPVLRCAELAAVYHNQRVAGDFYEFLRVGPSRVLFGLFDVAGRRDDTRPILVATQNTFLNSGPKLFAGKRFQRGRSDGRTSAMRSTAPSCRWPEAFAAVPPLSVAITRTWEQSAIPTLNTRQGFCATILESRNSKPADCRSGSFLTLPRAPRLVPWGPARRFCWSREEPSRRSSTIANSGWKARSRVF